MSAVDVVAVVTFAAQFKGLRAAERREIVGAFAAALDVEATALQHGATKRITVDPVPLSSQFGTSAWPAPPDVFDVVRSDPIPSDTMARLRAQCEQRAHFTVHPDIKRVTRNAFSGPAESSTLPDGLAQRMQWYTPYVYAGCQSAAGDTEVDMLLFNVDTGCGITTLTQKDACQFFPKTVGTVWQAAQRAFQDKGWHWRSWDIHVSISKFFVFARGWWSLLYPMVLQDDDLNEFRVVVSICSDPELRTNLLGCDVLSENTLTFHGETGQTVLVRNSRTAATITPEQAGELGNQIPSFDEVSHAFAAVLGGGPFPLCTPVAT